MKVKPCFNCKEKGFTMTNKKFFKILEQNKITESMYHLAQSLPLENIKVFTKIANIEANLKRQYRCKLCHGSGVLKYPKL